MKQFYLLRCVADDTEKTPENPRKSILDDSLTNTTSDWLIINFSQETISI